MVEPDVSRVTGKVPSIQATPDPTSLNPNQSNQPQLRKNGLRKRVETPVFCVRLRICCMWHSNAGRGQYGLIQYRRARIDPIPAGTACHWPPPPHTPRASSWLSPCPAKGGAPREERRSISEAARLYRNAVAYAARERPNRATGNTRLSGFQAPTLVPTAQLFPVVHEREPHNHPSPLRPWRVYSATHIFTKSVRISRI